MVFWLFALLIFVGLTALSALLQKKPQDAQPAGAGDFNFPTAEEGRVIPVVMGTVKIAPNVVWWGDVRADPIKKKSGGIFGLFSKKVTVGFRYHVGIQFGLCHGLVDLLVGIIADPDKTVGAVTSDLGQGQLRLAINQPELFGGDEKEGGLSGALDFYRGAEDQTANDYLSAKTGLAPAPPLQGMCYAVSRQMYVGTSPFVKPLFFVVRALALQYATELGLSAQQAQIGCDANPAVWIYAMKRNAVWGVGESETLFNKASFAAAAEQLHEECFGLSMQFDTSRPAEEWIREILRHIDGVVDSNPETGLYELYLIRGDYDPAGLLELDENDLREAPKLRRVSWEETRNKLDVEYIDAAVNFKPGIVPAYNSANHAARGVIAYEKLNYRGVSNAALAQRVAARELRALSYPIAQVELALKRRGARLRVGRPFRLTFPDLCLFGMVLRASKVDAGKLEDGGVRVEAYEDVFGVAFTGFGAPDASLWQDPAAAEAQPPAAQRALEAPFFVAGSVEERRLVVSAARAGNETGFEVWSDLGTGPFLTNVADSFAPTGFLAAAYSRKTLALDADGFVVENGADLARLESTDAAGRQRGDNLLLVDEEILAWTEVEDLGGGQVRLRGLVRGALDTLPADHAAGARVWFLSDGAEFSQETPFEADLDGSVRLVPFNARGVAPVMSVPPVSFQIRGRAFASYPPGQVRVNGEYWPDGAVYENQALLTWRHRHRAQQPPVAQQDYEDQASNVEGSVTVEVLLDGEVVPGRTVTGLDEADPQEVIYTVAEYLEDDPTGTLPIQFRLTPVNGAFTGTVRTTDPFFLIEVS